MLIFLRNFIDKSSVQDIHALDYLSCHEAMAPELMLLPIDSTIVTNNLLSFWTCPWCFLHFLLYDGILTITLPMTLCFASDIPVVWLLHSYFESLIWWHLAGCLKEGKLEDWYPQRGWSSWLWHRLNTARVPGSIPGPCNGFYFFALLLLITSNSWVLIEQMLCTL